MSKAILAILDCCGVYGKRPEMFAHRYGTMILNTSGGKNIVDLIWPASHLDMDMVTMVSYGFLRPKVIITNILNNVALSNLWTI